MYIKKMTVLLVAAFILTGCLYPDDRLSKNQIPNQVQLESLQSAVDEYKKNNPYSLPIKTRDQDTNIFQKYPIDYKRLREENLISEAPGNSFERGGVYQYVLIHVEDDPTVKVMDLRATQELQKINNRITAYRNEHQYAPYGERIAKDVYKIDHKKIGLEQSPTIKSPFSDTQLPVVMDAKGKIYLDYRQELYKALQEKQHSYTYGDDIRYILAKDSPIVPSHSLPYTIQDGEPVFRGVDADNPS
ncbi:hypothetical protein N780_12570 [Pontibacillus chungwhensis BH030062]|uniref:Lipoprotein n=1 Tax=Pontibacillus chungwhensis BH030062 TaxID=1385513 RepID=A0A0A2UYX9_9BACI|nr:hypothetical protein [Pontibacillus chungwhensis]KGP93139.1 hypothetical protein N780_12570 [Pontibacillus chungwhensis BH030062]